MAGILTSHGFPQDKIVLKNSLISDLKKGFLDVQGPFDSPNNVHPKEKLLNQYKNARFDPQPLLITNSRNKRFTQRSISKARKIEDHEKKPLLGSEKSSKKDEGNLENRQAIVSSIVSTINRAQEFLSALFPSLRLPTLIDFFRLDPNEVISIDTFLSYFPGVSSAFSLDPNNAIGAFFDPDTQNVPIVINDNAIAGDTKAGYIVKPVILTELQKFIRNLLNPK